ncbi:hypothetical protein R3X26_14530 [Vibrio sp. TH_r3]|uniref:hypothetical protein n=1 Tax=Vibrio sp. TH_r3 TaxID=3082084 RepID=UPI002953FF0D|nr:hypothetical protein [Vibrio sp. TH_r3]MDV7105620.1 hypothetical protein [Vibrio sp. TH_r3]
MIGFVAAITASLAVIILVVISSLIGFVQSIMPTTGIIKIDELTYRYNQKSPYVSKEILQDLVLTANDMSFGDRIKSYQNGCSYDFNANEYEMRHIATYNYIATSQFFGDSFHVDHIKVIAEPEKINSCFIDIHVSPQVDEKNDDINNNGAVQQAVGALAENEGQNNG